MKRRQLLLRFEEIREKYEPLLSVYYRWLDTVEQMTRDLNLGNFAARNQLPVFQKGEGVRQGLTLLEWNLGRKPRLTAESVIAILADQAIESTCSPEFKAGVKLILDDVLADVVPPLQVSLLVEIESGGRE